jgi:hypothetical protein
MVQREIADIRPSTITAINESASPSLHAQLSFLSSKPPVNSMDFDLLPSVSLRSRSFNALRALTYQLMTILEEACHTLIIIEHAPLLYSPGTDTFLENLIRNANRVFYFDEGAEVHGKRLKADRSSPFHHLLRL